MAQRIIFARTDTFLSFHEKLKKLVGQKFSPPGLNAVWRLQAVSDITARQEAFTLGGDGRVWTFTLLVERHERNFSMSTPYKISVPRTGDFNKDTASFVWQPRHDIIEFE